MAIDTFQVDPFVDTQHLTNDILCAHRPVILFIALDFLRLHAFKKDLYSMLDTTTYTYTIYGRYSVYSFDFYNGTSKVASNIYPGIYCGPRICRLASSFHSNRQKS